MHITAAFLILMFGFPTFQTVEGINIIFKMI